MGVFDHIPDATEGPAAPTGSFDHIEDAPKSGGAFAAKELTREQEIRRDLLMKMVSERKPGYEDRAADELSLGLIHPVAGVKALVEGKANEWFGGGKPATAGDYYRGGVMAQKDYVKQGEENTPGPKGAAVSLGSALVGGSGGPKVVGRGAQAGIAALQGLIGGASRNAEDVGSAAKGGLIGAGTNAAAQYSVGALLDRFKSIKGAKKDIGDASRGGNAQQMQADSGVILDKLDNAGIHFSGTETPKLANGVNAVTSGPLPASVRGEISEVVQDVNRRVQNGAMTFGDVRAIQSEVSKLKAHTNPDVRRVAKDMSNAVDDFFNTAKPTMPASSVGTVGPNDLAEARKLYATGKQSGKIEGIAEVAAGAKDPAAATSSAFQKYSDKFVKNPDKFNPNTPEQRRLIDAIGGGDPKLQRWANYADKAGNYVGGAGLVGLAGTAAGPITGTYDVSDKAGGTVASTLAAATLLKGGAGGLRHMLAERGAARVDDLLRNIATGSTEQAAGAYSPREALAKLIAKQDLAQGAGNYATSFINQGNPQP